MSRKTSAPPWRSPPSRWPAPPPPTHRSPTARTTARSGSSRPTRTSSRFVDTGKPGPSVGDLAIHSDDVLREDGSPAGTFRQVCTLTDLVGGPFTSTFECTGSITLKDGTIAMEGPFTPVAGRERRRHHRRDRRATAPRAARSPSAPRPTTSS